MPAISSYYSKLAFSGGFYHDMLWAVVRWKIALATVFAFLATARGGLPNMVNIDDYRQVAMQTGGLLESLSICARRFIEEIVIFELLRKFDYDDVVGYVACTQTENVPCSDGSRTGWFPYSWNRATVCSVPRSYLVRDKRRMSRACLVGEKYAKVRIFVHVGVHPILAAGAERQFCGMVCQ